MAFGLIDGQRRCDDARSRGADVIALLDNGPAVGGERHRIALHVAVNAPDDSELMRREVFGVGDRV